MKTTEAVLRALEARTLTLATAESCTGGMVGASLTEVPGSSKSYLGGVVSYTNGVKAKLVGVPQETLDAHGAVSRETAEAMAQGVRKAIGAGIGASVTGLAGPAGDGSGKPVGLVYTAVSGGEKTVCREHRFTGGREAVREQARDALLREILEFVSEA